MTEPTRTCVVHPHVASEAGMRSPDAELAEIMRLARAIDVEIVEAQIAPLRIIKPNLYLGGGKVEDLANLVVEKQLELVIVNTQLSPIQQRNLESALSVKVIDRTALILEIFGARARTREGMLQVELAAVTYQKSRLVRSWTHLERQRGGGGFMGGPGERQIESDRRYLDERIRVIKQQLEKVVKTRRLHRKNRQKVPYPIVALVGYTNAGKSTLFNRLTGADVLVQDALFATLDPTLRAIRLPSGRIVMLSDTVGFIAHLPTELVAAFRATLEEVMEADLLLHVIDSSSTDKMAQIADVDATLSDLVDWHRVDAAAPHTEATPLLMLYNKVDAHQNDVPPQAVAISALQGQGVEALFSRIDAYFTSLTQHYDLQLDVGQGKALAWLHAHGEVEKETHQDGLMQLSVRLLKKDYGQFCSIFGMQSDWCESSEHGC